MNWIEIKIDGAWDIVLLIGFLIAIMTSGNFVISYIRSLLENKTETNKLTTMQIVQKQIDILESQINSLTDQVKRLLNTNEETKLHKIELMKNNVILHDQINKLKEDHKSSIELLKDLTEQNNLLKQQNELLIEQIKELKSSKEFLKKEIQLLKNENNTLKERL